MTVDFLVAGVQKAGTTALYHFLRLHPQIFLPERKELHFFDDEAVDWASPDYDHLYHSHFSEAPSTSLWGEATPIYTYWPPAMARIHSYNPNCKLIILLRDPIERAYSHWRMETARDAETLSFSSAIREGRSRVLADAEVHGGYHRVFSYVERGFYAEQLKRVYAYFPTENVLLLKQPELLVRHLETLDRVCDFLGLDRFVTYPKAALVFSLGDSPIATIKAEDREYLNKIFAKDRDSLNSVYGVEFG